MTQPKWQDDKHNLLLVTSVDEVMSSNFSSKTVFLMEAQNSYVYIYEISANLESSAVTTFYSSPS